MTFAEGIRRGGVRNLDILATALVRIPVIRRLPAPMGG
jgi:hypothetical protein